MWCWRKLSRVPWTARKSNQSILKEINPEYSLEGLRLKLKLQHFGHLMQRANSLEKTLMLEKIEAKRRGNRGWNGRMASMTQRTWVWANSGRQWRSGEPSVLQFVGSLRVWRSLVTEQQEQHHIQCWKVESFYPKWLLTSLLLNIVLEVLAIAIRQEKE